MAGSDDQLRLHGSNERLQLDQDPFYKGAETNFQAKMGNRTVTTQEYQAEEDFQQAQAFKFNPKWVVEDILHHLRQLTPNAPLEEIAKELVHFKPRDRDRNSRPWTGTFALRYTIAPAIGFVAARMGWNRHTDPEVAYMSGHHLLWLAQRHLPYMERRVQAIIEGRRDFINEDAKATAIQKEQQTIIQVSDFAAEMQQALNIHVQEHLSEDPRYLVVLRALMYMNHFRRETKGIQIIRLLRQQKIDEALGLLPSRYH